MLPGFAAGVPARSGGSWSGSKVSALSFASEMKGQPKSGSLLPLRSTTQLFREGGAHARNDWRVLEKQRALEKLP